MRLTAALFASVLFLALALPSTAAAQRVFQGTVRDSISNSPLVGVNVFLVGTSIGAATEVDGSFRIGGVPERTYTVRISCIGYTPREVVIDFAAGAQSQRVFLLKPEMIEGEEVVITAQLRGQMAAMNQQITAATITNVVSKDRIQELPDNNAAEAIGRLPGISVLRDAGEGTKVVIRGMGPKYNPITIEGTKIPSTDEADRSVDLTMISSDMLAGVEVSKANTADKDGDAIGGTVNFDMKKAEPSFHVDAKVQGGYARQALSYDNYRTSASVSNRFYDNALGVLVEGNFQKVQRWSDEFGADYIVMGPALNLNDASLVDRMEERKRFGANAVLDYNLTNGQLKFTSLYSRTDRDEILRRIGYHVGTAITESRLQKRLTNINLFSNIFSGTYDLAPFSIHWIANYAVTNQESPFIHDSRFEETGSMYAQIVDQGPKVAIEQAKNRADLSFFRYDYVHQQKILDKDYAGQLDVSLPLNLTPDASITLKAGGKFKGKNRDVDNTGWETPSNGTGMILMKQFPGRWIQTADGRDLMSLVNFLEGGFSVDPFLNGQYDFKNALSVDKLQAFYDEFKDYRRPSDRQRLYWQDYLAEMEDYYASEGVAAAYMMADFRVGRWLTFLPGVRYEHTSNSYRTRFGEVTRDDNTGDVLAVSGTDTIGTLGYYDVLPMIHLRANLTDWADIRLAATKSITRPDYADLVPRREIDGDALEAHFGQPYIGRVRATNYDVAASVYNDYVGLFSLGGFYKMVKDIAYIKQSRIKFYGTGDTVGTTYMLFQPANLPNPSYVWGFEMELQTNLRFLPSPFDGLVINFNFSRIFSETSFPFVRTQRESRPPFRVTLLDTSRTIPMPGQSDRIANLSIGYDKGNFSGRVSLIYQSNALLTIDSDDQKADGYTDDYIRWDLAMQYKLTWGLSLYFAMTNLTNQPEHSFTASRGFVTQEKYFGWTADLGLRFVY